MCDEGEPGKRLRGGSGYEREGTNLNVMSACLNCGG